MMSNDFGDTVSEVSDFDTELGDSDFEKDSRESDSDDGGIFEIEEENPDLEDDDDNENFWGNLGVKDD